MFQILIGFSHAQIPILNFTNSTGYAHSADSKGDTVVALFSHVELIDDPNGGVIIDPDSSYYYCLFLYEETVLVKKLNIGDFRDGIFNLNVKIYDDHFSVFGSRNSISGTDSTGQIFIYEYSFNIDKISSTVFNSPNNELAHTCIIVDSLMYVSCITNINNSPFKTEVKKLNINTGLEESSVVVLGLSESHQLSCYDYSNNMFYLMDTYKMLRINGTSMTVEYLDSNLNADYNKYPAAMVFDPILNKVLFTTGVTDFSNLDDVKSNLVIGSYSDVAGLAFNEILPSISEYKHNSLMVSKDNSYLIVVSVISPLDIYSDTGFAGFYAMESDLNILHVQNDLTTAKMIGIVKPNGYSFIDYLVPKSNGYMLIGKYWDFINNPTQYKFIPFYMVLNEEFEPVSTKKIAVKPQNELLVYPNPSNGFIKFKNIKNLLGERFTI